MTPDLPAPENKRYYPALDGLRALAVLAVFVQHYLSLRPSIEWGWAGVDLFFVLSGFLITGILFDTRNTTHRFKNFYVRRVLRIFPLYYGVILVMILLDPIFHWIWNAKFILWPLYLGNYTRFIWIHQASVDPASLLMLTSSLPMKEPFSLLFAHFWSLCQEEQFYLVWPFVVFLIQDRVKLRNLCAILCVLTLAARILCLYLAPQPYLQQNLLYFFFPLRCDGLILGGMLALMLRGPEAEWLSRLARPLLYSLFAAWLLFEAIYPKIYHHLFYPWRSSGMQTFGYSLVDWFAGALILAALVPGTRLYQFLMLKPLRRLGQMSYGFYVFHETPRIAYLKFVELFLPLNDKGRIVTAALALVCTLVLSYLSFRYFETPFLRLKDRFTVTE